ncbi:pilus assembly protein PilM [Patescibacteria group bacterium]|nr:pilus assembly protein PilM [Patescibacteria group bacterium]
MASVFGLDIGSAQIKVCQAEASGPGFKLKALASEAVVAETEAEAVKKCVQLAGIKTSSEVNLALPESEVYTRIVNIPKLSDTELNSAIQYEAEQYIPVTLDEVELFHQILTDGENLDEKTMKVLLVAVPKEKLKRITALVDGAGLIPHNLETELFSLKRILAEADRYQLILLLSQNTTDIMAVYHQKPLLMHSLPGGGTSLTRSLVTEMSLSEMQAEQYKQAYGLRPDLLEGKVAAVLTPFMIDLVNQINKSYAYLSGQGYKKIPEQIVLAGGGALLPGLTSFLVEKLNTEVVVADPFKHFIKDETFKKLVKSEANPQWSVAAGLAIKGLKGTIS